MLGLSFDRNLMFCRSLPIKNSTPSSSYSYSKTRANEFQNALLNILDQMNSLGYSFMTPQDMNNLILQKDVITASMRDTYLLVEAGYYGGYIIEIQGKIDEIFLQENILPLGFSQMRKDPGAYSFVLSNMTTVSLFSGISPRRNENRFQNYMLKVLDTLALNGWNVLTTHGYDGPFLLQKFKVPQPGSYILLETCWFEGMSVEVQVRR